MRWHQHLFMGEQAKKQQAIIIDKINNNRLQKDVYVITLSSNPQNLLDLYPSYILLQPYYKKQDYFIVGIAKGYEEALLVVKDMVTEVYQKTGDVKLREYLVLKQLL